MIAGLTGQLGEKAPSRIILDVHGVGYEIFIPLSTYFALPHLHETLSLKIYTHLRDNAIQLFGFLTPMEKEAFVLLTGISGVGGKLALSILSTLSVPDLRSTIQSNDVERLVTVPGIGKKSAGRIVLELKDKVSRLQIADSSGSTPLQTTLADQVQEDAVSALANLGYRLREVHEAVKQAGRNRQLSLADLIRETLKELTRK